MPLERAHVHHALLAVFGHGFANLAHDLLGIFVQVDRLDAHFCCERNPCDREPSRTTTARLCSFPGGPDSVDLQQADGLRAEPSCSVWRGDDDIPPVDELLFFALQYHRLDDETRVVSIGQSDIRLSRAP